MNYVWTSTDFQGFQQVNPKFTCCLENGGDSSWRSPPWKGGFQKTLELHSESNHQLKLPLQPQQRCPAEHAPSSSCTGSEITGSQSALWQQASQHLQLVSNFHSCWSIYVKAPLVWAEAATRAHDSSGRDEINWLHWLRRRKFNASLLKVSFEH